MNALSTPPEPALLVEQSEPRARPAVRQHSREAQQGYQITGAGTPLVRWLAGVFGGRSTVTKLWMVGAVPLATALAMSVPLLLAANALAGSAGGEWSATLRLTALGAILLGAFLSWLTVAVLCRDIVTVVTDIIASSYDVLEGRLDSPAPHQHRRDEYGQIAQALEALRENMIVMQQLQEERWSAAQARDQDRLAMVTAFERSLGDVIAGVASAASQLHSTAGVLAAGTEQTREQTDVVTRAIQDAASGTTAAAAASDEFAMSIGEISRQAGSSAELARRAREAAVDADAKISRLTAAAAEIGHVVDLIQSIAQRTNLLALNASIEAARGGEAGRGFAVVASEVKDLAAQTSRATERVAQQIADIQGSTGQSVQALQSIGEQVKELELTAISIASAVDQQSIAGRDLAQSLDLAARATDDVSDNVAQVRDATHNTGIAAAQVLQSADELHRQAGTLRGKSQELVQQFRSTRT